MDVYRINVKFYLQEGRDIAPDTWFKAFNTWVPAPEDSEILVDVADYSHVHHGPVTVLVGHYANYAIDNTDGELGLLYARKRPQDGSFSSRLRSSLRAALNTCRRLENDPNLGSPPKFRANELLLQLNDRLLATNADDTLAALRPELDPVLADLYGGADVTIARVGNSGQRFSLRIKTGGRWDAETLLKNLEKTAK